VYESVGALKKIMDNATTNLLIGAASALVLYNLKDFWRSCKKWDTKRRVEAARNMLEKPAITDPPDQKIGQAVKDIERESKKEYYLACFDWNDRERLARVIGEKGKLLRNTGGVAPALDFLKRTLKDEDVDVRIAAVTALGNICHAKTVPALIQALRDASPYIRQKAAVTLRALRVSKPEDVDVVIRALQDNDANVRCAAAEALGEIKEKRATSYLMRTLKDPEWYVRRAVALALGKIEDPQAIAYLMHSAREDCDAGVRAAALTALAPFGDSANQALFDARVVEVFKEAKKDNDEVFQAEYARLSKL